ncbi:hypothetical protein CDCA_CDCA07G2240 [Cyanidium caldarium]|uniref:L-2-amino-thiazoline-4-carboxylic acid hydrolase n=1 Tax=Cyanidium caldarium TaxID=2771 RepID=A0AAV9IVS1_CYACA|nr:hypothetical protein CDCA_CDCA07G2240 [Cyanidium caldarium]
MNAWDTGVLQAVRWVYVRTLPLAKQPELQRISYREMKQLVQRIEERADAVYDKWTRRVTERCGSAHQRNGTDRSPPEAVVRTSDQDGAPTTSTSDTDIDSRTRVHLSLAALALGTYRILLPLLANDESRTVDVVGRGLGLSSLRYDAPHDAQWRSSTRWRRWMMRVALMMTRDARAGRRRFATLFVKDLGTAFDTEWVAQPAADTLFVKRCLYADVFRSEGAPALTRVFCAMDAANFAGMDGFALQANLAHTADRPCRFHFPAHRKELKS